MSKATLQDGFYLVNQAREIVSRKFSDRADPQLAKAIEEATEPVAVLEVLEQFNNYAWGE